MSSYRFLTSELLVNNASTASEGAPSIVRLNGGNLAVLWHETLSPYTSNVYVRILKSTGEALSDPILVGEAMTWGMAREAEIAALNNGGFAIVWGKQVAQDRDIAAAIFDATGIKTADIATVSTSSAGLQYSPAVTALADGGFLTIWNHDIPNTNDSDIRGQIINAMGVKVGAEFGATTKTNGLQFRSSVTTLSNGNVVAVWEDAIGSNAYEIRGQIFNGTTGAKTGSEFMVSPTAADSGRWIMTNPSVEALSNGGFVATYHNQYGDHMVYAQIFDAAGSKAGAEIQVSNVAANGEMRITALNQGGFVVAYSSSHGSQSDVYLQVFAANGHKVGDEFIVHRTIALDQAWPDLTQTADGRLAVVWSGNGTQDSAGIYLRLLDTTAAAPTAEPGSGGVHIEGSTNTSIAPNLTISNPEGLSLTKAEVRVISGLSADQDSFFANLGTSTGDIAALFNASTGTLTLTSASQTATLAEWQNALRSVTYTNTSDTPSTTTRVLAVTLTDTFGEGGMTTTTLMVTATNDPPILTAVGSTTNFVAGDNAVDLFSAVALSTVESGQSIERIVVQVTGVLNGADEVLRIDNTAIALGNGSTGTTTGGSNVGYLVEIDGTTATLTLTKSSLAVSTASSLIDGMTYGHTGSTVTDGQRLITVVGITDNGGTANGGIATSAPSGISAAINVVTLASVTEVAVPANDTYKAGDELYFTVTFSRDVIVTGAPVLRLILDTGGTVNAEYKGGSSSTTLTFSYVVDSGVSDLTGITVDAIDKISATIQNMTGHDALLAWGSSLPSTTLVLIDGIAPTVESVIRIGSESTNGTTVQFEVTFSEAVTGLSASQFNLISVSGDAIGTVTDVSGVGTLWTVTANIASGNGVVRLDFDAQAGASLDSAGNPVSVSFSSGQTFTIDTIAPPEPAGLAILAVSDTGASDSDGVTSSTMPTFRGTAEANSVVEIFADAVSLGTTTANGVGEWAFTPATALADATYAVTAQATDMAGNVSDASAGLDVTIDTTAPTLDPVGSMPSDDATRVSITNDIIVAFSESLDPLGSELSKVYLKDVVTDSLVPAAISINGSGALVINPTANLRYSTEYYVTWDTGALQDRAGNSAAAVSDETSFNFTTQAAPPKPPTVTPPSPSTPLPVDGVPVTTTPGDGGTTIISIPVVKLNRPDTPGTPSPLADIPLVKGTDGHSILLVSVPVGVALQAQGMPAPMTGAAALAELILRIERSAGGDAELTHNGQVFLATLDPAVPLTIQTITATVGAGFHPDVPLVISGSAFAGDGMQAVILDARALPSGTTIQVDNVDFLAVVGAVRIIGGAGQNMASGDGAAQYIVLGADDDIIHGGGGNDTVGSKGGDDKVYGDAGDDIVFGGAGQDILSGGSGSDRLNGGTGFDVAIQEGKRTDYTVTLDGAGIKLTHVASGVSDWLVDVEQVRFETGPILTVAHSAAEEAAAFLFKQWMGRDLTQSEGAVIQTLDGLSAMQVADLFAQVFPQQAGGRTAQQLLEGMETAGAIRVDADRSTKYVGDAGDNTFTPTLGMAWNVDGGAGIDTLVFPATLAQTYIDASTTGFTLQRMVDGAMLELINVERLTFSDTKLALDLDGHAGQAAKLLGALGGLGLLDNKPLVSEVIRALDAGVSAQSLAQLGLQVWGVHTPVQITQLIWTNVVGSAATPAQLQTFVDLMAQGVTGGELAVLASNLDLNATRIDLVGLAATGIEFA